MERENPTVSIVDNTQKDRKTKPPALTLVTKRKIWALLSVLACAILVFSLWDVLQHTVSWCKQQVQLPYLSSFGLPSLYASALLVAAFGLLSVASAVAVMVPAALVTWITIVVLLSIIGKSRRTLAAEGRRITKEIIVGFVGKILFKEGSVLGAVCAVLGYLVLFRMN